MRHFFKRMAVALCSGYIIAYYGEFVFWATPDREWLDVPGIIAVWLAYSVFAYLFFFRREPLQSARPVGHFPRGRVLRPAR